MAVEQHTPRMDGKLTCKVPSGRLEDATRILKTTTASSWHAAAWLANQVLRTPHAMSAGTSLAPPENKSARFAAGTFGGPRDSDYCLKRGEIRDFFDLRNVGIRKNIRRMLGHLSCTRRLNHQLHAQCVTDAGNGVETRLRIGPQRLI